MARPRLKLAAVGPDAMIDVMQVMNERMQVFVDTVLSMAMTMTITMIMTHDVCT